MARVADVVNKLLELGHQGIRPWTSRRIFGHQRIYTIAGHIEISGKFGFQVVGEVSEKLVNDCLAILEEFNKPVETKVSSDNEWVCPF